MDAPPLSPERARELTELRRRAYGPGADIGDDPHALARLRSLEDLARTPQAEPSTTATDEPTTDPEDVIDTSTDAADAAEPSAFVDEPQDAAPARSWWQRVPWWAPPAAALVVGIAIGAGGLSATLPRPDAVLRVAPEHGGTDATWQRELQAWGINAGTVTPYDEYNGVGVWLATSDDGGRCLVLENDQRPVSATCIGAGFDPILDVTMYGGMDEFFDAPPPTGSVIRFVGHEGSIEVWLRERQSIDSSWIDSVPSLR